MFVTPGYAQDTAPVEGEAPVGQEAPREDAVQTEVGIEDGHGGVFPPFDASSFPSQLLWLAITFGLFYVFLKRVALPRIGGILEVRRDHIAQDLDTAARLKDESDAALAAYEQALAEARGQSGRIAQEARDKAKESADQERRAVEAELDEKLAAAEGRIASVKASAMKDVGAIAQETAAAIVQQLGGGEIDRESVAAAVASVRK